MMRCLLASLLLPCLLLPRALGQTNSKSNTGATAINTPALLKMLDSLFAKTNNTKSPGCAVTVLQHGKPIAKKAYGMASIEHRVAFTHQSVLKMPYSEAREFIAIAAVLMDNDGLIKLDDKVQQYFPQLPAWSAPVTIWDLLNHRSGFVDEWATLLLMHNSMANRFEHAQFLHLLYSQPTPQVEPGKGYMYCNSDFGLLRLVMEKAAGKKLPDWMQQRIFTPLKMLNSAMQQNPLSIVPNRATLYDNDGNGGYEQAKPQKTSPGGNYYILTTAADLEHWLAAITDAASEISRAAQRLMENVRQIPGKDHHYVVGYSRPTINEQELILHEGVNGFNYLSRVPSKGLAVITLGNRHGSGFAEENKAIINYLLKVPPVPFPKLLTKTIVLPDTALNKYTGNYRWLNQVSWEGYRQPRKFSSFFIAGGKLKARYTGNYVITLTPVAKDVFYYQEGFGLQLVFSQATPFTPMRATATYDDGFPGELMEKDTAVAWQPDKALLAGFTGKYYSKHLDYFWNITMNEAGQLVLKRNTLPETILEPDGLNQFHYIAEKGPDDGFDQWLLFNKDSAGAVTGITVWSARVMHHQFDKQKSQP